MLIQVLNMKTNGAYENRLNILQNFEVLKFVNFCRYFIINLLFKNIKMYVQNFGLYTFFIGFFIVVVTHSKNWECFKIFKHY